MQLRARSNNLKPWLSFLFLGCVAWGTSFLWIKVALREIGPFTIVSYRMFFGCVSAWLIFWFTKQKFEVSVQQVRYLLLLGIVNTALPMTLITWAETRIESGMAGILNGTLPLFTMLLSHWFFDDDRITLQRFIGLLAGFFGIFILMGGNAVSGRSETVWGELAMIAAVLCYAGSLVFIRKKLQGISSLAITAISLNTAFLSIFIIALIFEAPFQIPALPITWLSVIWMGILGMSLAYLAVYYLLRVWGATRVSMVTYVFPVWSVLLGTVFLKEPLTWQLWFGGALIIFGIACVNYKKQLTQKALNR